MINRKFMKNLKVNAAVFMAAATITAGAVAPVTAYAAEIPSDAAKTAVTVKDVDEDCTVTAYRIVKPVYNTTDGFQKFEPVSGVNIANIEAPTSDEITSIAQGIINGDITPDEEVVMSGSGNSFTADLSAGEYVVLVKNGPSDADAVYNPMVVSAYFTDAQDAASLVSAGDLSADSDFSTGGEAYAKKVTIPFDKTIINADGNNGADDDGTVNGSQGDELGVGDTGTFQITTQIPAYSTAYEAKGVMYQIVDTQDDGFDAPTDITVEVGGTVVAASASTFTQTITGNDFEIDFNSDFALANAGKNVVVTYKAKLNENAVQKLEANNDTATLKYTHDAYDRNDITELTDDVQEYTFPIQVRKTNEDDTPLAGAEFKLTRTDGEGKTGRNEITVTTDSDGVAQFDRLDEGTYTLKETKAPANYSVNPDTFQIVITPTYGSDGKIASYKIDMTNQTTGAAVGSIVVDNPDDAILAGNVLDSELQNLPATGGQGTRNAMIAGAGLVIACGAMVVTAKKMNKAKEKA